MTWENLKKAELGQSCSINFLRQYCSEVYGGVAWPGIRPGFAVIVAKNYSLDNPEFLLLDEFESSLGDLRDLVRKCCILDLKYRPNKWVGDGSYGPARRFIEEVNINQLRREKRHFSPVEPFELLEMKPLYPYLLGELKRLLEIDHRRLFLPENSKVISYLMGIEPSKTIEFKISDYPAIEALSFVIIELLGINSFKDNVDLQGVRKGPWSGHALTRGTSLDKTRRRVRYRR